MEEIPLLKEILTIFALSIGVLLICHRLHLPSIIGFLLTGMLCGPHGFKLISAVQDVQTLANIGIVFLLFTVGMEVSIKKILELKRFFLIGGSLQVGLTIIAGYFLSYWAGYSFSQAIFLGLLLSLSSTAIVLRILDQKMESDTPHGRIILAILIFQDVCSVPMMLVIPFLAGVDSTLDYSILHIIGEALLVIGISFISAWYVVPKLLFYIAKTRSRELFLMGVLTICMSVAWLASSVGLSLSLGAFLAGLIISESEYSHEAIGDVLPFQDIFTSFFFVSVGMLFDVSFILQQPLTVFAITLAVLLLKSVIAGSATLVLGMPMRTAILSGIALSQIGEFSFVLAKTGLDHGIATEYMYQLFLGVSILTMAVSPTLITLAPRIAKRLLSNRFMIQMDSGAQGISEKKKSFKSGHAIIIGFGISGRNLAHSCKQAEIPYVVLEMNPETVRKEKLKKEPILFGDATHESILNHLNITEAKVIAILINDSVAAIRIVKLARRLNPNIYLIVRTRYVQESKLMYQLGADDVIPDEFGSSVEVFTRVLRKYDVDTGFIQRMISEVRTEGYDMLRLLYKQQDPSAAADLTVDSFRIPEMSQITGKTLAEAQLRKKYGLTVMMIKRKTETLTDLNAETVIKAHDLLVVLGSPKKIAAAVQELRT